MYLTKQLILVVNFMIELVDEVVEHLILHIAHGVFLLGILADLTDPDTTSHDIVLADPLSILLSNLIQTIVVKNHLVCPCPLVFTVVVIDLLKAVDDSLNGLQGTILDIIDQTSLFTLRQQQS